MNEVSRRRFLAAGGLAVGGISLFSLVEQVRAADPVKLPLDNPQAKALAYIENAEESQHPSYKAGSNCANCNFIQGADGEAWRPCQLFAGFVVANKGWCSAWAKKVS